MPLTAKQQAELAEITQAIDWINRRQQQLSTTLWQPQTNPERRVEYFYLKRKLVFLYGRYIKNALNDDALRENVIHYFRHSLRLGGMRAFNAVKLSLRSDSVGIQWSDEPVEVLSLADGERLYTHALNVILYDNRSHDSIYKLFLLKKAAASGCVDAQSLLGLLFHLVDIQVSDLSENRMESLDVVYFTQAADADDMTASYYLAQLTVDDQAQSKMTHYVEAALMGYSKAYYGLLAKGYMQQDLQWLEEHSSNGGSSMAQYILGLVHREKGEDERAFELLSMAKRQGETLSRDDLQRMYISNQRAQFSSSSSSSSLHQPSRPSQGSGFYGETLRQRREPQSGVARQISEPNGTTNTDMDPTDRCSGGFKK